MIVCNPGSQNRTNFSLLRNRQATEAYFDTVFDTWVLSEYDDVIAALRSDALRPVGARATPDAGIVDDEDRLRMRAETIAALSSSELEKWREETGQFAGQLLSNLALKRQVDLVGDFAKPLCQRLAWVITKPVQADLQTLFEMAYHVSAAAAEPFDLALAAKSEECETALKGHFLSGPAALRESGFVALSQTLPCLLCRCWVALLQQPNEWTRLHENPPLMRMAVDELFRHAGLTQTLFRKATAAVNLNGIRIRQDERLMLRIDAANRDPARFTDAESLDFSITRERHLALGFGKYSCVAGPLLRMVLATSTHILVHQFRSASIVEEIQWRGGSGFRFPEAIHVVLRP